MANEVQVQKMNQSPARQNDSLLDFDTMIERFFGSDVGRIFGNLPAMTQNPRIAVQETEEAYVLDVDLPGVPKDDIEVEVNGNLLTVHAEHQAEKRNGDQDYVREYRAYHQTITLPTTVDSGNLEAQYENGRLEILLPKSASAQSKRVKIQESKGSGFLQRLMGKRQETKQKDSAQSAEAKKH